MNNIEKEYASIHWIPQDIINQAAEDDLVLNEQQAEEFLVKHQDRIVNAMCAAGWDVIRYFLFESDDEK